MKRLTPERYNLIKAREFFGIAKKVIAELCYEIDELNAEILRYQFGLKDEDEQEDQQEEEKRIEKEYHDENDTFYQQFQERDNQRNKLTSVLKMAIKEDSAKKFFSKLEKK